MNCKMFQISTLTMSFNKAFGALMPNFYSVIDLESRSRSTPRGREGFKNLGLG